MKKNVSFVEEDPLIVANEEPISSEEHASMFYSKDEITSFVIHCKNVMTGQVKDECTRGLEPISVRRKLIVLDILREHRRQKSKGEATTEALAKVAQQATAERIKMAEARGKQDALEAREGIWGRFRNSLRLSITKGDNRKPQSRTSI